MNIFQLLLKVIVAYFQTYHALLMTFFPDLFRKRDHLLSPVQKFITYSSNPNQLYKSLPHKLLMNQCLWNLNFSKTFCIYGIQGSNTLENEQRLEKLKKRAVWNQCCPKAKKNQQPKPKTHQHSTTSFKYQSFLTRVECKGTAIIPSQILAKA